MRYFISYAHYEHGAPFMENAEWDGEPITSLEQIETIEAEICQNIRKVENQKDVFVKVLFWRPFEGQ